MPFELHVVPPTQSNAELSRTIDSFAQATDADLAAGQQALQAQLREVLQYSAKVVPMLVGGSTFASDLVRAPVCVRVCAMLFSCTQRLCGMLS